MATKVRVSGRFEKDAERLKRKYPRLVEQIQSLILELEGDQRPGDKISNVGFDVYKVRLHNPDAGRGKSGGFRAIYYVELADQVILITLYSKSEQADVSLERIRQIIDQLTS